MTGSERKRIWRLRNPERSRAAEQRRAQARRDHFWDLRSFMVARFVDPTCEIPDPKPCASAESNQRYELSAKRWKQRLRVSIAAKKMRLDLLNEELRVGEERLAAYLQTEEGTSEARAFLEKQAKAQRRAVAR